MEFKENTIIQIEYHCTVWYPKNRLFHKLSTKIINDAHSKNTEFIDYHIISWMLIT